MKKLVSLLLLAAMLCVAVSALAEYPDVVEGIDFDGATIYIYDYWSGDGARSDNPTEEQAAQYAYRDWLEETYNCHIIQMQKGDWGSQITEFNNFYAAPDGSLTLWIIEPGSVGADLMQGYFAPWDNDLIDITDEKWNASVSNFMTKDGQVCGVYTGATEPRQMLYFNKKVLADAGIDYNEIYDLQAAGEWTWDKLEEYVAKLTRDTDNDGVNDVYGLIGDANDFWIMSVFSNGASFFDWNEEGKLVPTMGSDVAIESLNWAKRIWTNYAAPQPEGSEWNWYKDAWKQGYAAFYMYQGYGGFNDNSEMADMTDPWGAVAFPIGPKGTTYLTVGSDNVTVIPNVYDEETVAKLTFIYDMWTRPTPGFDDENAWIGQKYSYTDARAVDETYAMLREGEHAVFNNTLFLGQVNDVLGQPLLWQMLGNEPSDLIDANMPSWQAMCDDFNAD